MTMLQLQLAERMEGAEPCHDYNDVNDDGDDDSDDDVIFPFDGHITMLERQC